MRTLQLWPFALCWAIVVTATTTTAAAAAIVPPQRYNHHVKANHGLGFRLVGKKFVFDQRTTRTAFKKAQQGVKEALAKRAQAPHSLIALDKALVEAMGVFENALPTGKNVAPTGAVPLHETFDPEGTNVAPPTKAELRQAAEVRRRVDKVLNGLGARRRTFINTLLITSGNTAAVEALLARHQSDDPGLMDELTSLTNDSRVRSPSTRAALKRAFEIGLRKYGAGAGSRWADRFTAWQAKGE